MRRLLLIIPLMFALNSCSSSVSSGFTVFLTGLFVGNLFAQTDFPPPFSGDVQLNLVQNDDGTLEGNAIISDPETTCWSGGTVVDPDEGLVPVPLAASTTNVTSSVTGNRVVFIIEDVGGATITIDGTATNNSITAFYTSEGGPCANHSGTFNANRV